MSYYYDNEKDARERRIDYDLSANVEFNGSDMPGFRLEDVAYVLAYLAGENDGPAYHWIVAMKDHTYAFVTGSCDYTGWDCQSSGSATIVLSMGEALRLAEAEGSIIFDRLCKQLVGEASFGESTR